MALSQDDFIMLPSSSRPAPQRKDEQGYPGLQSQANRTESGVETAKPPPQQVKPAPRAGVSTATALRFIVFTDLIHLIVVTNTNQA